ncbi:hypothetical protein MMC22_011573 [Lobaria immixta]|nr:hypothetical protein [Lobaria immixta]
MGWSRTKKHEYSLVAEDETCSEPKDDALRQPGNCLIRHIRTIAVLFIMAPSLAMNVLLLYQNINFRHLPDLGGLGFDTPVIYQSSTDYWGDNETLADELWNGMDTDPIVVALTDDYAQQHGLKMSGRFPWDDEKGIYFLKAFHNLHCLKLMRKAFVDYQRGNEQIIESSHIHHCLDSLRQDVMCKADDTPMPTSKIPHHVGDGQVLQCRDWNKLIAWAHDPERNACHRMLDDYRPISHSLERHAFCPKNSPYYSVQTAYFEKHGHKDPWEPRTSESNH